MMGNGKAELGKGKREILGLELVEFKRSEIKTAKGLQFTLWECGLIPPVHINSIFGILDDFYDNIRFEYIADLLGSNEEVIIHVYGQDGLVAIEDYNKSRVVLQIKSEDKNRLLDKMKTLDKEVMGELYEISGLEF